jgi:transitional endoplasmic reticulum ATPase
MIDPALIRSGRFDRLVMVGEPDVEGRERIFQIHTDDTPLSPDVSLRELAERTEGYVGSDIESVAREAAIQALRDDPDADLVEMRHFRQAMENVRPTVTDDIRDYFEEMKDEFKGGGPEAKDRSGGRIGFQ